MRGKNMKAIKLKKRIEKDGKLEIKHLPIAEGEEIEVIILVKEEKIKKKYRPLDLYGAGKGIWKTAQEVDSYIEEERASWDD